MTHLTLCYYNYLMPYSTLMTHLTLCCYNDLMLYLTLMTHLTICCYNYLMLYLTPISLFNAIFNLQDAPGSLHAVFILSPLSAFISPVPLVMTAADFDNGIDSAVQPKLAAGTEPFNQHQQSDYTDNQLLPISSSGLLAPDTDDQTALNESVGVTDVQNLTDSLSFLSTTEETLMNSDNSGNETLVNTIDAVDSNSELTVGADLFASSSADTIVELEQSGK